MASATNNWETAPLPELDMGTLMPLVMALLGMGALRSYEKKNNLTKQKDKYVRKI